jgi:hypothetical protein
MGWEDAVALVVALWDGGGSRLGPIDPSIIAAFWNASCCTWLKATPDRIRIQCTVLRRLVRRNVEYCHSEGRQPLGRRPWFKEERSSV